MNTCSRKHENLPVAFKFCPYCGEKIVRINEQEIIDSIINEALLKKAKRWPTDERQVLFFQNVLNLPNRIAYTFMRYGVTPEQVVTMSREELLRVPHIGKYATDIVITNRVAYNK